MKKRRFSALKFFGHPDHFGELLGYEILSFDRKKRRVRTRLAIGEKHLSPSGRMHGGVLSAFFDFSCGAAVFTTLGKDDFCATVEMKVNYLQPVFLGDVIMADVSVMFRGRKICVVHALLYKNKERQPAAMATATFNVVPATAPDAK